MKKGIKEKDIRDFEKYANKLDELMKRIQEYHPTANYYLNMDDLQLMCDAPFIDGKDGDIKYNENAIQLKDRFWLCPQCNTYHNRDENASYNIKNEGLRIVKEMEIA